LDKTPGVRPIGVGKVVRRIITTVVLSIIGPDIQRAAGIICNFVLAYLLAAIHCMRNIFSDKNSKGFLFVDASNAFNSLSGTVHFITSNTLTLFFRPSSSMHIVFQHHYLLMVM